MSESDPQSTSREVVKNYTRARKFPQLLGMTPDGKKLPGGPYSYTQFRRRRTGSPRALEDTRNLGDRLADSQRIRLRRTRRGHCVGPWQAPHRWQESTLHGRRREQSARLAGTSTEGLRTYTAQAPSTRTRRHGHRRSGARTRGTTPRRTHRSPGPHGARTRFDPCSRPHPGAPPSFTAVDSPASTGHPTRCIHQRPASCRHGRRIAQHPREGLMLQPITAVGGKPSVDALRHCLGRLHPDRHRIRLQAR